MTCHRLTSERKSYWLPLLCLRLRYHDNVYGQRKCSLLVRDYPFVWQRHANPYDFCLLFRPLSHTYMISSLCLFHPPSFPVVHFKAELFSSLDVGMLSGSFFPFRSLAPSLCFSLSLSLSISSLSVFLLLLLPRPRQRQEYFLLLHGYVLSGISHIHHVITVIFSALRHVALPFLLFDSFEARTRGREIRKEFVLAIMFFWKRSVIIGNCHYSFVFQR